jgi:hypothetical protein
MMSGYVRRGSYADHAAEFPEVQPEGPMEQWAEDNEVTAVNGSLHLYRTQFNDFAREQDAIRAELLLALEALTDALDAEMAAADRVNLPYPNEDRLAPLLKTADAIIARARGTAAAG